MFLYRYIGKIDNFKYLGLHMDHQLKWKIHIVYQSLENIFMYSETLEIYLTYTILNLRLIYLVFVQSVITFGIEIWRGAYNLHLVKLKTIKNKLIKYILRLRLPNLQHRYNLRRI